MSFIREHQCADDTIELIKMVERGAFKVDPNTLPVVGAFWVKQSTQFPGTPQKYHNHYLLLRVGAAFGGCCVEGKQTAAAIAEELSGTTVAELLRHPQLPVRIAALDAYFAVVFPHIDAPKTQALTLPQGTPLERAVVRDEAITSLLPIQPGQKVGLIGVVNPLVAAIEQRGGQCLPCDFNMERTQSGIEVAKDMNPILEQADMVIATGMTLSNGSFDNILAAARRREIPLIFYAQTGSAIIPRFLGSGVTAVAAEPFPYSQFSADPTRIYLYRHEGNSL